jgi:uncharacterized protein DUF3224
MTRQATAKMEINSWEEQPYHLLDETRKLTWALVTDTFHGDIEGTGTLEYLMAYLEDGTVVTVALERVVGRLAGREGGFVLRHDGGYADGVASGTCTVVPGSGTGELRDLRGQGSYSWPGENGSLVLDYEFAGTEE